MQLMWWTFLAVVLTGKGSGAENPVLAELLNRGVAMSDGTRVKLPPPQMRDGADAAAQRTTIASVAGARYTADDLARKSVVAPFVLNNRSLGNTATGGVVRGVDIYFVAHGRWDVLTSNEFRELMQKNRERSKSSAQLLRSGELDAAALARRKLVLTSKPGLEEHYDHAAFTLFDKVEVSGTCYNVLTRTDNTSVTAGRISPRFDKDAEYPNRWRSVTVDLNNPGHVSYGPAEPYRACGFYAKITRLGKPAGAIFVEYHLVYEEPHGWFGGVNLLHSKLPLIVQNEVRAFRRKLAKASDKH
jgi:hypothetical protein